jgi:hypothetical protein
MGKPVITIDAMRKMIENPGRRVRKRKEGRQKMECKSDETLVLDKILETYPNPVHHPA